jgi:hypothetical protein
LTGEEFSIPGRWFKPNVIPDSRRLSMRKNDQPALHQVMPAL